MNPFHFHHMSILTGSTELELACQRFYTENFGMRLVKPRSDDPEDDYLFLTDNAGSGGMPLEIMGNAYEARDYAFLERHGSGIDHIAFEVSNVDAVYEAMTSKGVSFHVPPYDYMGTRLAWCRDPAGVEVELILAWDRPEVQGEPAESAAPPAKFNHVAILVGSRELAEKTERFYQEFFEMEEVLRGDPTRLDMDWAYFAERGAENPFWLEVVGATDYQGDLAFLEKYGPGMDHICFVVEDADGFYVWLKGNGLEFESDLIDYVGSRMFYLRDPAGVLVQVIQMPKGGIVRV